MLKLMRAAVVAAVFAATTYASAVKSEVIQELRYEGNYLTTMQGVDGCLGLCRLSGYIRLIEPIADHVISPSRVAHIVNPSTFFFTDGVRTVDQDFVRVNNASATFDFYYTDNGIDFNAGWLMNIQFQENDDPYQRSVFRSAFVGTGLLGNNGTLDQSYDILPLTRLALTFDPGQWTYTRNINAVPEPSTWAMLLAGFGMLGWTVRRRRKIAYM